MQIFTLKISCSPFGFSVVQGRNSNSHNRLRAFVGRRENAFRFLSFIFNLQYVYGMFHCGLHKMFCFIQEMTQLSGKRVRDAAFFFIIMLVTFAATLLKPQKYVSSRTIQKCVEHVSTST